jgi:hypothetical protein
MVKSIIIAILAVVVLALVGFVALAIYSYKQHEARVATRSPLSGAAPALSCQRSDITIKRLDARIVDECKRTPCPQLRGVAVLTNGCSEAIGVQLKIVGLDASGAPIATKDFWPASVSNIPPGDFTFSLDYALDADPRLRRFTLEPVRVERWRDRQRFALSPAKYCLTRQA